MEEPPTTASPPLTPDYFQRQPEASAPDSAQPAPEPKSIEQKPRKPQRQLKRKKRTAKRRGPLTEVEALQQQIAELRFRKDNRLLDAQLRIGNLRSFLQSHDLWEPFLEAHPWW